MQQVCYHNVSDLGKMKYINHHDSLGYLRRSIVYFGQISIALSDKQAVVTRRESVSCSADVRTLVHTAYPYIPV